MLWRVKWALVVQPLENVNFMAWLIAVICVGDFSGAFMCHYSVRWYQKENIPHSTARTTYWKLYWQTSRILSSNTAAETGVPSPCFLLSHLSDLAKVTKGSRIWYWSHVLKGIYSILALPVRQLKLLCQTFLGACATKIVATWSCT